MLAEYYGLDPSQSSLYALISAGGVFVGAPIAAAIRTRRLVKRRSLMFFGLALYGAGAMMRTGNLTWVTEQPHIAMVCVGMFMVGVSKSLLSTSTFPEVVDSVEMMPDYQEFDEDEMQIHLSGLYVSIGALA